MGGQVKQVGLVVHGKYLYAEQTDALDNAEVKKLHACYKGRLVVTKTLVSAALQLYAGVAFMCLPIPAEIQPRLIADRKSEPFVEHALSSATCELYHRYGMLLAPLTGALTKMKLCQLGDQCPIKDKNNVENKQKEEN